MTGAIMFLRARSGVLFLTRSVDILEGVFSVAQKSQEISIED